MVKLDTFWITSVPQVQQLHHPTQPKQIKTKFRATLPWIQKDQPKSSPSQKYDPGAPVLSMVVVVVVVVFVVVVVVAELGMLKVSYVACMVITCHHHHHQHDRQFWKKTIR